MAYKFPLTLSLSKGHRTCAPCYRSTNNRAHTAEAIRARSLARREGPVWDAYAGCDRAPFNWEKS